MPVYSYGKLIGSRIVHNDRLLMFMLRNRAPTRFAADGRVTARRNTIGNPEDANRLSRLKGQWRKEWQAEREADDFDPEATADALDARLDAMQDSWLEGMTPRTRALYQAYTAAAAADEAAGHQGGTADNADDNAADNDDRPEGQASDDHWAASNVTRRIELSDFRDEQGDRK